MTVMIVYIVLIAIGTVFYYFTKINLKRRRAEQEGHTVDVAKVVEESGNNQDKENTTADN